MSDDLISRRAAIKEAHKAIYDFFDMVEDDDESPMTYLDEKLLEVNKAITNRLRALPSAQPRWIPVTEGLPEDGAEVWVTTDMLFEVTRARWHKDSNLWCHPYNSDCLLVLRPIAWMEMSFPEPYKGGVE